MENQIFNIERLQELIPLKWQTFDNYKTNLSNLKKYIDLEFGITSNITVMFYLTKTYIMMLVFYGLILSTLIYHRMIKL